MPFQPYKSNTQLYKHGRRAPSITPTRVRNSAAGAALSRPVRPKAPEGPAPLRARRGQSPATHRHKAQHQAPAARSAAVTVRKSP